MIRLLLPLVLTAPVFAEVIGPSVYLQAPEAPGFSWGGTSSYFTPGLASTRHIALGFVLGETTTATSLRFWGLNIGTQAVVSTQFRVSVWRSDGVSNNGLAGSPGTLHYQETFALSGPQMEQSVYPGPETWATRYEINFGPAFTLTGGERYWLSIAGSTEPGQSTLSWWGWADAQTGSGYGSVYNIFSNDSWVTFEPGPNSGGRQAFELFGVPTPSALAAFGVAGVLATRRRRGQ